MSNLLKMAVSETIRTLHRRGWSQGGRWSGFDPWADLGGGAMGGWSNGKTPALQAGDRGSIPRPVHCMRRGLEGSRIRLAGPPC